MDKDWIIFYDDGSVADSDTDMRDVPRRGVELIAQRDKRVGYQLFYSDGDYFVYDADRGGWRWTDQFGVYDHLITCKHPLVLFGREMETSQFKALVERAKEYCGPKSAWVRNERPKSTI